MKIAVRLFVSSMVFAIAIAGLYYYTTRDLIGVVLLGIMALALAIVAGYIVVAEKEANLASDQLDLNPGDFAGERLGTFATQSAVPLVAAMGTAALLLGVVFAPDVSITVILMGAVFIAWCAKSLLR